MKHNKLNIGEYLVDKRTKILLRVEKANFDMRGFTYWDYKIVRVFITENEIEEIVDYLYA